MKITGCGGRGPVSMNVRIRPIKCVYREETYDDCVEMEHLVQMRGVRYAAALARVDGLHTGRLTVIPCTGNGELPLTAEALIEMLHAHGYTPALVADCDRTR